MNKLDIYLFLCGVKLEQGELVSSVFFLCNLQFKTQIQNADSKQEGEKKKQKKGEKETKKGRKRNKKRGEKGTKKR